MLATYLTATQNLLQTPGAPTSLYSTANLTLWINTARAQLAGESESIRRIGTVSTVVGQRNYNFGSVNVWLGGTAATTGVAGIFHVRRISYDVGDGEQWITPSAWPWFDLYHMNNPVPVNGAPEVWSQYAQGSGGQQLGSSTFGSFYLDPPPDTAYTLNCDCVCYPIALADDATIEGLPYLWTDCVPYFAAYLAYLSSQTGARQADAMRMMDLYKEFVERARKFANPSVNRWMYEQSPDPTTLNKLGMQNRNAGGG